MKQTAIEWIKQQLYSKLADSKINISTDEFYKIVEKAKAMEEKETIDTFNKGMEYGIKLMQSTTREV
jgi:hypothetical protein